MTFGRLALGGIGGRKDARTRIIAAVHINDAHGESGITELTGIAQVEDLVVGEPGDVCDLFRVGGAGNVDRFGGVDEDDVGVVVVGAMADMTEGAQFKTVTSFLLTFAEGCSFDAFAGLESATRQIPLALVALNPFGGAVGLELFDFSFANEEVGSLISAGIGILMFLVVIDIGVTVPFIDDEHTGSEKRPAELLDGLDGGRSEVIGKFFGS